MRPKNSCSGGPLVPDRGRLEPLPLLHGAVGREHVHARLGRVRPPARGAPGTGPPRWRMCQWPLTGITPNSVKRVRSAGRPSGHDQPAELGRRRLRPAALEQAAAHAPAGVRRARPTARPARPCRRSARRARSRRARRRPRRPGSSCRRCAVMNSSSGRSCAQSLAQLLVRPRLVAAADQPAVARATGPTRARRARTPPRDRSRGPRGTIRSLIGRGVSPARVASSR